MEETHRKRRGPLEKDLKDRTTTTGERKEPDREPEDQQPPSGNLLLHAFIPETLLDLAVPVL